MPLLETSGNNTASAYSGGVAVVPNYIEDVFSTWLYTGTSAAQTINNGIDLAGKGGMVWIKRRNGVDDHYLQDSTTNFDRVLRSNTTGASELAFLVSPTATGYIDQTYYPSTTTAASWTFRKQPKFFDVVTYTGDGTSNRPIAHSLGSVPGCIIVKSTSTTTNWMVWHRSLPADNLLTLNSTAAQANYATVTIHDVTSTNFQVDNYSMLNASGVTYVAYLFAHNAGGFGLTGTDNVISCGSYTGNGSTTGPIVTLGYEPQWLMVKKSNASGTNWIISDNMRGMPVGAGSAAPVLFPNTSDAEYVSNPLSISPLSTGFQLRGADSNINANGDSYIYIAIRRGPMKVPTDATKVFAPATRSGTGTTATVTSAVSPIDMLFSTNRDRVASSVNSFWDRLRGGGVYLNSNSTNAEASSTSVSGFDVQNGVTMQGALITNGNSYPYVNYNFKRAPSFFDEVCYTGTGTAGQTFSHNLAAVPELMIVKCRSNASSSWRVLYQPTGIVGQLESTATVVTTNREFYFGDNTNYISPTSSVFTVASNSSVNTSARTYVAYLFATCAGVSKVSSYTGNGTTQAIACGFTGGARFVLIKRTDAVGDWYVYDTARGMTTLTDPYLLLNSTAAESATLGSVTTTTGGFTVNAAVLSDINTNAATYIFLAIA